MDVTIHGDDWSQMFYWNYLGIQILNFAYLKIERRHFRFLNKQKLGSCTRPGFAY